MYTSTSAWHTTYGKVLNEAFRLFLPAKFEVPNFTSQSLLAVFATLMLATLESYPH